jgi:ribosome assembly protein 4
MSVLASFKSPENEIIGPSLQVPIDITPKQLEIVLNNILKNEEHFPYSFFVDSIEILNSISRDILSDQNRSSEDQLIINYHPQAAFRVHPVSRCTATLSGHTEAILSVAFSPNGLGLATASGDTTVRIWDLNTETPMHTCKSHSNWVLCISWSPCGNFLASGGMDSMIYIWDPKGKLISCLKGHSKWVTSLSWEPFHLSADIPRLASSSRDGTVRVWNITSKKSEVILSQHTDAVSCVKWGGENLIYTASRDKTVKVWDSNGKLVRSLIGHAHWINTMALSTDHILRLGMFDLDCSTEDIETCKKKALERYKKFVRINGSEKMITGSDDFTMYDLNI